MYIHEIALCSFARELCSLKTIWLRHYNSHTHDMGLQHYNGSKYIVSHIVYTWYIHGYTMYIPWSVNIHGIYMVYTLYMRIRISVTATSRY